MGVDDAGSSMLRIARVQPPPTGQFARRWPVSTLTGYGRTDLPAVEQAELARLESGDKRRVEAEHGFERGIGLGAAKQQLPVEAPQIFSFLPQGGRACLEGVMKRGAVEVALGSEEQGRADRVGQR